MRKTLATMCTATLLLTMSVGCSRDTTPALPDTISEEEVAAQLFQRNCATCHGAQGRGDGPAAAAYPRVGDLSNPRLHQRLSDEDLRRIMHNGVGRMPPAVLTPVETEAVLRYVRTLAP